MERAQSALQRILSELLRSAPAEELPALAWRVAAGPSVAGRTTPRALTAGVLTIEVPDRQWQAELRELAPKYLAAMNRALQGAGGATSVERLEFVLPESGRPTRVQ